MRKIPLFAVVATLFLAGCGGVSAEFLEASEQTRELIDPRLRAYVTADAGMTEARRQMWLDLLETWRVRNEKAK